MSLFMEPIEKFSDEIRAELIKGDLRDGQPLLRRCYKRAQQLDAVAVGFHRVLAEAAILGQIDQEKVSHVAKEAVILLHRFTSGIRWAKRSSLADTRTGKNSRTR